jgi:hypothetical protein
MTRLPNFLRVGLLAATVAFAGCGMMSKSGSSATEVSATLSGAAEVPPNNSAGTGTLTGSLDQSTNVLKWKITYSGLSGPATAAHFHGPASAGSNAGVVLPFSSPANPIEGQATLTAPQAADLLAGKWYANVHTKDHPGGEIRGQVMVK